MSFTPSSGLKKNEQISRWTVTRRAIKKLKKKKAAPPHLYLYGAGEIKIDCAVDVLYMPTLAG